jgi:hypothetical protein
LPLASLTACSGDAEQQADQPRLAAAVASDLAQRSDRVADPLAAGDVCGAAVAADELQAAAVDAVNRGRVPSPFQEELTGAVNALVDEVNCPPPPAATEDAAEEDDEGNGKGKKGEKKR